MDEHDEFDQESDEDTGSQSQGFEGLDPETKKFVKNLRKENQGLRDRLHGMEQEALVGRFGEDVVGLIPEEVRDYEKRASLAEKFAERFKANTEQQPDAEQKAAQEEPREEPSEQEKTLATLNDGASGTTNPLGPISWGEFNQLYRENPAEAVRVANARGMARPPEIGT